MSSSKWVRYPDNSRDGLFACGCGSRIIVCWNPGADFECPKCNAEVVQILPEGTFRESGTNIATMIVVAYKP